MDIFSVRIDQSTKTQVLQTVRDFLHSNTSHTLFTPNPEMLVAARRYSQFRETLNRSDLNICDGFGIQLLTLGAVQRMPGVDLMLDICRIAQEEGKSIFLLGSGSDSVLEKTKTELLRQFPRLNIVGMYRGISIEIVTKPPSVQNKEKIIINYELPVTSSLIEYTKDENDQLLDEIISVAPDILFVAFGHIKQETWIVQNLAQLPSVRLAMGVGGSFDFVGGSVVRAPILFRSVGLEWLWRLLHQPRRFWRIVDAVIVFPCLYFFRRK
jgi:N-acetylglucosaminyldiphosphoundecaprenol N-acetyl-beta-D-mannosaminyltransferase